MPVGGVGRSPPRAGGGEGELELSLPRGGVGAVDPGGNPFEPGADGFSALMSMAAPPARAGEGRARASEAHPYSQRSTSDGGARMGAGRVHQNSFPGPGEADRDG